MPKPFVLTEGFFYYHCSMNADENFRRIKKRTLLLSILFDGIGLLSYIFPVIGESIDFVWAPIAGFMAYILFGGIWGLMGGIFIFLEELMPLTDIIPSFILLWFIKFVLLESRTKRLNS